MVQLARRERRLLMLLCCCCCCCCRVRGRVRTTMDQEQLSLDTLAKRCPSNTVRDSGAIVAICGERGGQGWAGMGSDSTHPRRRRQGGNSSVVGGAC